MLLERAHTLIFQALLATLAANAFLDPDLATAHLLVLSVHVLVAVFGALLHISAFGAVLESVSNTLFSTFTLGLVIDSFHGGNKIDSCGSSRVGISLWNDSESRQNNGSEYKAEDGSSHCW